MNMRKIRWGVLSTSRFGTEIAIPAMQKGKWSEILAIASRDLGKAQSAAQRLGIPRAYGSYEELLADPEIEAVYNPLPNHLHGPWSIRALEAGKHVLCEKPIARTAIEAGELRAVHTTFSFFNENPADIRNRAEVGGAAGYRLLCDFGEPLALRGRAPESPGDPRAGPAIRD